MTRSLSSWLSPSRRYVKCAGLLLRKAPRLHAAAPGRVLHRDGHRNHTLGERDSDRDGDRDGLSRIP